MCKLEKNEHRTLNFQLLTSNGGATGMNQPQAEIGAVSLIRFTLDSTDLPRDVRNRSRWRISRQLESRSPFRQEL
jgi:hypothetical protein